jgi:RecG-like helicase
MMPPHVLKDIKLKLCFSPTTTFTVNLGNDRLNIATMVCRMRGSAKDLGALNFVVDEAKAGQDLIRTIIFFNKREVTYKAYLHLWKQLPDVLRPQIEFLHALRSSCAKNKVMKDFRAGNVKILCATEAAGMVHYNPQ